MSRGRVTDLCRGKPLHLEKPRRARLDRHVRPREQLLKLSRLRRAHVHDIPGSLRQECLGAHVGDQPAAAYHDQMIGSQCHLAHQMRRDEHCATLRGEPSKEVAHPVDPFGIQSVDGLVEHHRLRIADQRRRDSQPLTHPE